MELEKTTESMIQVNEWLNELSTFLNNLYGLPGITVVFVFCLFMGYVLKITKPFPNVAIPWLIIVIGGAVLPLISDFRDSPLPLRIWLVRNLVFGMLIGLLTWIFHNKILSKIEDKIPFLKDWLENCSNGTQKPEQKG
jgi:hypothetical protein